MRQDEQHAIGIDIGGTKIAIVLINREGNIVETKRIPTQLNEGVEAILFNITEQINQIINKFNPNILGIGIASPGYIDTNTGIVINAVNLRWKNVPIVETIKKHIPKTIPVFMQRDTAAETLGEYYYGAGNNCRDFVYLGIGTGLGAGALSSGTLITGKNNLALEIGHLSLDVNGPFCSCGNRGCMETLLSGNGLVKRAAALYQSTAGNSFQVISNSITTKQFINLAKSKDPIAISLSKQMAESLGLVCAMLKTVLDPEKFIIGGGLGKALFNLIIRDAEAEMNARTLNITTKKVEFYKSTLESSAMGAAAMVWYFNEILPELP